MIKQVLKLSKNFIKKIKFKSILVEVDSILK